MSSNSSLNLDGLKSYALPLTAVVVVVAAVPLAIMPWFTDITEGWAEYSEKTELHSKLEAKVQKLESFDIEPSKALLEDTIEPALPSERDPAGLLGTIDRVANQADVAIASVTYSDMSNTQQQVQEVEAPVVTMAENVMATVLVEGTYENIVSFVASSERVLRIINLDSLHFSKVAEEDNLIAASFDVSAPFLPHPTTLGPVETPFPELTPARTKIVDMIKSDYSQSGYSPTRVESITGRVNPF